MWQPLPLVHHHTTVLHFLCLIYFSLRVGDAGETFSFYSEYLLVLVAGTLSLPASSRVFGVATGSECHSWGEPESLEDQSTKGCRCFHEQFRTFLMLFPLLSCSIQGRTNISQKGFSYASFQWSCSIFTRTCKSSQNVTSVK